MHQDRKSASLNKQQTARIKNNELKIHDVDGNESIWIILAMKQLGNYKLFAIIGIIWKL